MMRFLFALFLLLSVSFLRAQEKVELNDQDGIHVSYVLTKISGNEKKDKYVVSIKSENRNDYAVFYGVSYTKNVSGAEMIPTYENKAFAKVNVRNSTGLLGTGLFGANQELSGQETKYRTTDNKILFTIGKKQIITNEIECHVPKGEKPIITNAFSKVFQKYDAFDIALSEGIINGSWTSVCGSIEMNLLYTHNERGEQFIQQSIEGRQIMWKNINPITYEKLTDRNITLTYNKTNQTFIYKNPDGVICNWIKK